MEAASFSGYWLEFFLSNTSIQHSWVNLLLVLNKPGPWNVLPEMLAHSPNRMITHALASDCNGFILRMLLKLPFNIWWKVLYSFANTDCVYELTFRNFYCKCVGYEGVFERRSFGGELEEEELIMFFKECDLMPAEHEIHHAMDLVFKGTLRTVLFTPFLNSSI